MNEIIKIKTNNSSGFTELVSGGGINIAYPESLSRRGRVIDKGNIIPTLQTGETVAVMSKTKEVFRVRKLTPRECYRLMGVKDSDIDKMIEVNPETQSYKQAGNSIVVQVLEAIFDRMFIHTEPLKGQQMDIEDFL